MSEFAKWDSFYAIVGSAAGALIGLQFVVVTLIAQRPALRVAEAGSAFATPTIVHFGTALFLSAVLRVPWQSLIPAAAIWGMIGCAASHTRWSLRAASAPSSVPARVRRLVVSRSAAAGGIRGARRGGVRGSLSSREALFVLEVPHWCYCSPAFTMPGTALPTMHLRARRKRTRSGGMTIPTLVRNEGCGEWNTFRARLTKSLGVSEPSTLHSSSSSTTFWSLWLRIS